MWLRFRAWLTGGRVVILQGHRKQEYRSIAYPLSFGGQHAAVYPMLCYPIGDCLLLEDGSVDRVSESSYIYFWRYE